MKKLAKIISAAVISTAFLGTAASAATCSGTISITNTGPGSNNTFDCTDVSNIVLNCSNDIVIGTVNTQTGSSGNSDTSDNTSGGNAASGQVVNDNGNDVTIGGSCDQLAAAPTAPSGGGAATPLTPAGGTGEAVPEVLPNTANSPYLPTVLGILASVTGIVIISRLFTVIHRHFTLH